MSDRELIKLLFQELKRHEAWCGLRDCLAQDALYVAYDRLTRIGDDEEPYAEQ